MDLIDLSALQTEGINAKTTQIDQVSTLRMCAIINEEDQTVATSISPCLPTIAHAIDALAPRVRRGGRVIYVGAGTSGRLGILDASEIPPTFAAPFSQFVGLIAGGDAAIRQAQEGAEDSVPAGEADLLALNLVPELDSVIGIAASGRTPYVLGCLSYAKQRGCLTIGVACSVPSSMGLSGDVDFMISPLTGPEVVTGSTRLKAGTATKLVLNMLSTGTMIRIGKTYGNMMVDLVATNLKLRQRSRNILRELSKACSATSDSALDELLSKCNRSVKLALMVVETGLSVRDCEYQLESAGGVLSKALLTTRSGESSAPVVANGASQLDHRRKFGLCVDGGGTKCAAVIADHTGIISRGVAGPCNLTDQGTESAVATISLAVERALGGLNVVTAPENLRGADFTGEEYMKTSFASVWLGLAGVERPGYREKLIPQVSQLFGLEASGRLQLTSDVDLLAAAMRNYHATSAVVLIAGTGSVAMRYVLSKNGELVRVARSGGWGHLLGDEGAGYAIGLQAIRLTLSAVEEMQLGLWTGNLGTMRGAVLRYFGCDPSGDSCFDLLDQVLRHHSEHSTKVRIAGVAQVVLDAAEHDKDAAAIVSTQIFQLVDNALGRLLDTRCKSYIAPEQSGLILSGGIMQNKTYQTILRSRLDQLDIRFQYIELIRDSASTVAKFLASTASQELYAQN